MGNKKKANFFVRFLGNRNTVTLLGMLACVLTLVIGYNVRVQKNIDPSTVPYAKDTIESRTLITADMIGKIKICGDYLNAAPNTLKNVKDVEGKYATYKSNIPKGSLFYKEMIKEADDMPDSAFADIPDGYTIFSLDVTNNQTYGGQISAGQYIDLYMSARANGNDTDGGTIIFAKLIESIRVLAVKDKNGNNIIDGVGGTPAELLFAVPENLFLLLSRASFITDADIEITPVIRNHNYTVQAKETQVPYSQLESFIMEKVTVMGEDE